MIEVRDGYVHCVKGLVFKKNYFVGYLVGATEIVTTRLASSLLFQDEAPLVIAVTDEHRDTHGQ